MHHDDGINDGYLDVGSTDLVASEDKIMNTFHSLATPELPAASKANPITDIVPVTPDPLAV